MSATRRSGGGGARRAATNRELFPTFVNEELSRVEAGPDGRRRVGDVSLQKLKGILLWMPLRPVNGVTVGCRELD